MSSTTLTMRATVLVAVVLAALAGPAWAIADDDDDDVESERPVPVSAVAGGRIEITTPSGRGTLAIGASRDLERPQPDATRVVVVIHGWHRAALSSLRSAETALATLGSAGGRTLLIAPQFLADLDMPTHRLPADLLRWTTESWESGGDALGPAPVSSFEVLDALLARLADRARFPALVEVVIAGHSGGGQIVQRYAIVGHGDAVLAARGVRVRYVVANPSSYAYFSAERPDGHGGFAPFANVVACPHFDRWKFGMHDLPRYAGRAAIASLEQAYVGREITFLLGTADANARDPGMDRGCAAEAQGPYRHARGMAFAAYMQQRHPSGLRQHVVDVPNVGHSARAMFNAPCGIAVLFTGPDCSAPRH
jgi:hypothetical protein